MAKKPTRDVVLAALRQQQGAYLSSAALTQELGVTRAAIWKAVTALREEGYPIRALPGGGYALTGEGDVLSAPEITRRLTTRWLGRPLICLAQTASLNSCLKEQALAGSLSHGLVAVAAEQTAGRGRDGRSFFSPPGGLYFAAALRHPLPLTALRQLTMAAAVAVCQGIADGCGLAVQIKWPNDLYWQGKKLGGILTECSLVGESGELEYAVCGVGLNLADVPFPPALRETAVSLAAALAAPPPPRAVLLAALLARLEAAFDRLLTGADGAALLAAYRERLLWVGEPVAVWRGREREEAIFLGVDQEGRALLRQGERTEAMASGEIHLRGRK